MNVFITGASGFIGSNLSNRLLSEGHHLYVLMRNPPEQSDEIITYFKGDILNPCSFQSFLEICELLFHCAACISFERKAFQKAFEVNVSGTERVLEAAYQAGVRKVVHLSACAVLGFSRSSNQLINEAATPFIPETNVYAYTKNLAEQKVREYVRKGLDVSIANIATVYGPGDRKLNSGSIIKSIYEGRMRVVPPGGTSYVAVQDVVEGLLLLAERGRPGERYIFCSENMEYRRLAQRIARVLKVRGPALTLPGLAYYPSLLAATALNRFNSFGGDRVNLFTPQIVKETFGYKYFSSEKAQRELDWRPVKSLEDAVITAFEYYRREGLL